MQRNCLCAAVTLLLSLATALRAEGQRPDTAVLSTMVVTGTKSPASRTTLSQAVTIMTGDELRARGIARVSDALRGVPGVNIVENGSVGSVSTMFLRGGESRFTKVLIDGVAVNAPGGFFDFSHLTTDNVERIEVVRGPASVIYGADAVSGVVNIITRQGKKGLALSGDVRAGTYDTRDATVEMSGTAGPTRYSLGGGAHRTDGVFSFNNQYYNGTLSGSAGFAPSKESDALITARYTAAEFHYPTDYTGAPVDSNAYRVQHRLTLGFDTKRKLAESIQGRLLAGTNEVSDLTEDISVPFGATTPRHSALFARNKRRSLEAGVVLGRAGAMTVNAGAEYVNETERSTASEGPVGGTDVPVSTFAADRDNNALYAEVIGSTDRGGSWTIAGRRDDNSDYDAFNTYRVGVSLPFGTTSRLRSSYSTAFNAPAFNQLRPTLFTVGSPDLKPERTRSWEVGVEQSLAGGAARVAATYFNQRFSDLIQFVSGGPPNFLGRYANLTEAVSNGYELEVEMTPDTGWSIVASYTNVKPHVSKVSASYAGDLEEGDALLRRPRHSAHGALTWNSPGAFSFSIIGTYVGSRPDLDFVQFPAPLVTLPAYTKVDLAASFDVFSRGSAALSVTTRIDNALDRRYEDVLHFTSPRRTLLVGARFSGSM